MSRLGMIISLSAILIGYIARGQQDSIEVLIKVEYGWRHNPIQGVELSDSGLFVGKFIPTKRMFAKSIKFKYKSIFIPKSKLNKTLIGRIKTFLAYNNYFENIGNITSQVTGNPTYFKVYVPCSKKYTEILDYYGGEVSRRDRYLLNELMHRLNQIIPNKYEVFRMVISNIPEPCDLQK